jgi:hypothetical protein
MPRGVQFRGSQELQQDVLTSTTMRKADGRDHWIFRFSDSLLLLGGALELIAYLHLGWAGLVGANLGPVGIHREFITAATRWIMEAKL